MQEPTARPIIMAESSIKGLQGHTKRQTRRLVWPLPPANATAAAWIAASADKAAVGKWQFHAGEFPNRFNFDPLYRSPFGEPGDHLWVKEGWAALSRDEWPAPLEECDFEYRADAPHSLPGGWPHDEADSPDCPKWRSARYMPRIVSRFTLDVLSVGIQRLEAITVADALEEGVEALPKLMTQAHGDPVAAYGLWWNLIHKTPKAVKVGGEVVSYIAARFGGEASTATYRGKPLYTISNPFVWRVRFRVIDQKGNEDGPNY